MFKNTYKKKLKAFMTALECEQIDAFMKHAITEDYINLGTTYVNAFKQKYIELIQALNK